MYTWLNELKRQTVKKYLLYAHGTGTALYRERVEKSSGDGTPPPEHVVPGSCLRGYRQYIGCRLSLVVTEVDLRYINTTKLIRDIGEALAVAA